MNAAGPVRISAIVCTYRRYDLLAGCLASLAAQSLAKGHCEIVVVDNSGDCAQPPGFAWPDGISRIAVAEPGLSRARNAGVAAARGDLVAFIDDDAEAEPDWLAAIVEAFDTHRDADIVGGPVSPVWPHGRPGWLDPWHDGFLSIVDRGNAARALSDDEWLAGTNIAFRKAAVLDAGGFAEALGRTPVSLLGNEEIQLARRIRRRGGAVRYDPAISVRHRIHPDRLEQSWMRRRVAWQAISDQLGRDDAAPDMRHDAGQDPWRPVSRYLGQLPPVYRNFVGLLRDESDPHLARAQAEAIAAVVTILTMHGESLEARLLATG